MPNATTGIYVGCATDRKFVDPTCAMLSSLDDNADLAGAVVLVADFGLDEHDRTLLRDSAGQLGSAMRFVPLDRASPKIVVLPAFDLPLPLLGRLVLPREIAEPNARLLLIDSDMVVNHSLRPLFEMDMLGRPLAAVQDPLMTIEYRHHRKPGPSYFNAGLMLLDVDRFNAQGVGEAAMRQLAAYERRPIYLDQCALNDVLAGNWLELDRQWNLFQTGYDPHMERPAYDAARIIHFAGPKPWEVDFHPATPVWNHHATRAQQKRTAWQTRADMRPLDRLFFALQYEVLLGRPLEADSVAVERATFSLGQALAVVLGCDEFRHAVLEPLLSGKPFEAGRFGAPFTRVARYWATDRLPILAVTAERVTKAASWRDLLSALVEDGRLMGYAGMKAETIPQVG